MRLASDTFFGLLSHRIFEEIVRELFWHRGYPYTVALNEFFIIGSGGMVAFGT